MGMKILTYASEDKKPHTESCKLVIWEYCDGKKKKHTGEFR